MVINSIIKDIRKAFSGFRWSVYGNRKGWQHNGPLKIAVCDDHRLFRQTLAMVLDKVPDFEVVLQAANGKDLIDQIATTAPDVVLLDLTMPIMDGYTTADYLLQHHPNIRIVLLTKDRGNAMVGHLLRKGVCGFVSKDADPEELETAIREFDFPKQYWKNANTANRNQAH